METNTQRLINLGKEGYLAAIAVRGGAKKLAADLEFGSSGSLGNAANRLWFPEKIPATRQSSNVQATEQPVQTVETVQPVQPVQATPIFPEPTKAHWSRALVDAVRDYCDTAMIATPACDQFEAMRDFIATQCRKAGLNQGLNRALAKAQPKDSFTAELYQAGVITPEWERLNALQIAATKKAIDEAVSLLERNGIAVIGYDRRVYPLVSDFEETLDVAAIAANAGNKGDMERCVTALKATLKTWSDQEKLVTEAFKRDRRFYGTKLVCYATLAQSQIDSIRLAGTVKENAPVWSTADQAKITALMDDGDFSHEEAVKRLMAKGKIKPLTA